MTQPRIEQTSVTAGDPCRQAPATERNREAILEVLREVLPASGTVLEIASGTGQHAAFFASRLAPLAWQPSDPDPELRQSIVAWAETTDGPPLPPLALDALRPDLWRDLEVDAIVSINLLHIAPWAATEGLMAGAGRLLAPGAPLVIYGPFMRDGKHTAESNEAFDATLKAQDSAWGVRDVVDVTNAAVAEGLTPDGVIEMPANNLTLVFRAT